MIRRTTIIITTLLMKLLYHHKVYGKKRLPKAGGIIAANHSSYLDPPLIGISCPHEVHFLGRESLFRSPLFAWYIRKLYTHPVARGKGNIATIRKCLELLKAGKKVVIFPEGTRSQDGNLHKGQLGVGMLVLRTKCLVIPTYIHGSYEIWSCHRKHPKFKGKTACVFGKPLDFSHFEGTSTREMEERIAHSIMNAIAKLRRWYLDGAKGSPP